jgi:hypothetical protein
MAIPQPERLMRIFDQGFQHDLDRRFQSTETLSVRDRDRHLGVQS